jgi:membrane protease YdiL (CAAX protease family)
LLALGLDARALGLGPAPLGPTLAFAGATYGVLAPILLLVSRTPAHQARYPELRVPVWTPAIVWTNVWTWVAYLFAYELFFRGFLLGALVGAFGLWPGVAVMTALYVFVHLPKGAGETVGCIPMGIVFAWMTLETGAIWAAVLTHIGIALTSDLATVRASASFRFGR